MFAFDLNIVSYLFGMYICFYKEWKFLVLKELLLYCILIFSLLFNVVVRDGDVIPGKRRAIDSPH